MFVDKYSDFLTVIWIIDSIMTNLKALCSLVVIVMWVEAAKLRKLTEHITTVLPAVTSINFLIILAPWFPACTEGDPNFDDCVKASFKAAIQEIIKGDPSYLKSVSVSKVEQPAGFGFTEFNLTDIKVHGLEGVTELNQFQWRKESNVIFVNITVPELRLSSSYHMKGKFQAILLNGTEPVIDSEGLSDIRMGK